MKNYKPLLSLYFIIYSIFYAVGQISHGPVIGGVASTSAKIYLRTQTPQDIILYYSTDSSFVTLDSMMMSTNSILDNSVIVNITNLLPSTVYYLSFKVNDTIQQQHGKFKTFPVEYSPEHLIFVTGSCQETENMKVFDVMPLHQPDLFIHTGDFTYPSYQISRYYGLNYPEEWNAVELSWQKRYEEIKCKDMLMKMPIAYMPDDDDSWGNSEYYKGGAAQIRFENNKLINYFDLYPRTEQMRTNCLQAYQNFFPGYPIVNDTNGYYHSFIVGNCEFFMIDTRSCNTGGWNNLKYSPSKNLWTFNGNNPSNSILGAEQLQWLLNALKNSTATWKFIISGVPFNKNFQTLVELPLLLQGVEFDIGGQEGTGFRLSYSLSDYFGAYAYERNKILNHIKSNNIENVIVISGDTHGSAIDDGNNAGLPEMNASGLSVRDDEELYLIFNSVLSELGLDLKKWLWNKGGMGIGNDNYKNAFGKIEVFNNDSVKLCIIDEDNTIVACHTILNKSTITTIDEKNIIINDLFSIYPNPASNYVNITVNEKYKNSNRTKLIVYDVTGKSILVKDNTIDNLLVDKLASGCYFIALQIDGYIGIQKFTKK